LKLLRAKGLRKPVILKSLKSTTRREEIGREIICWDALTETEKMLKAALDGASKNKKQKKQAAMQVTIGSAGDVLKWGAHKGWIF